MTIDTTGPSIAGASATISPIAGDDVVNAAEAALDVPVTVTLAGVPPDAATTTVTINVGGTDYPATDNGDGTWTAEVPGSAIAANTSITATAVFTDTAGNDSAPVNDTRPYTVDTGVPAAPTPTLENDTGTPGDGITNDGTVEVNWPRTQRHLGILHQRRHHLEPRHRHQLRTRPRHLRRRRRPGPPDRHRRQHQRRRPARPRHRRHHRPRHCRRLGDHLADRERRCASMPPRPQPMCR